MPEVVAWPPRHAESSCLPMHICQEESASIKHEYVDGEVYAMVGASERHNRIAGNTFYALRSRSAGTPCTPYVADMRLRIVETNAFYYPDVMLCCDPGDAEPQFKVAPCAIVEVLSPATRVIDEREKLAAYRRIASLRYYILVDSETVGVTYYERVGSTEWQTGRLELDDILNVHCGGQIFSLSLFEFYDGTGLLRI